MSAPEPALRECWRRLAGDDHHAAIDDVVARYREPHRRYHTAVHVMWVLRHVAELLDVQTPVGRAAIDGTAAAMQPRLDGAAIEAAALFHDVVYDPRSSTNERDSALLAIAMMGDVGWSPTATSEVARLVEATATHTARDPAASVLIDADLAILGARPDVYRSYVAGVRAEYAHVSADAWRTGRSAVLRSFLEREHVFATETMRERRERRAVANLRSELAGLAHLAR